MAEIVIRDRAVPRVLTLLPAVVVVVCIRVLTLGTPPVAVRALAAGAVAVACWTAYRLLTAAVTVTDSGVTVRGVFYDADVSWADLDQIAVEPASPAVRMMLWGVLEPLAVSLTCKGRTLRPIGLVSSDDDDDVERAVGAMRVRSGAWRMPSQRMPADDSLTVP